MVLVIEIKKGFFLKSEENTLAGELWEFIGIQWILDRVHGRI